MSRSLSFNGADLRDNNVILLTPLAFVARIVFGDWAAPKDTEGVGRAARVWASRSGHLAWTALKVGVETLTSQGTRTPVRAFLNVVARHDRISVILS